MNKDLTILSHFHLKIVYTLSKGEFSIFLTWSDLGSLKHQTEAEIDDAYRICQEATVQYDSDIASIPVDNAARTVAAGIAVRFPDMEIVVSRDPSHCIDLLSKDLAGTDVVKRVMREAKEVRDFVKIDRIDSIREEAAQDG